MDIIGGSLSAAAVIAVIIFMRRVMFTKIPKRVLSALWLIAAVKLLLPYGGIFSAAADASDTAVTEVVYSSVRDVQVGQAAQNVPNVSNMFIKVAVPVHVSENALSVMNAVWLFGAVFAGAYFAACHIKSRKTFSCAVPADYDIEPLKNDFGIIRRVRLLVSDRTDTPLTYGVSAPVVILPKSMDTDGGSMRNVLCHELAHVKRFDALFKTVIAACAAVHWFNPLVWAMFVLASRDVELACDETALRFGKAAPEDYAMALIRVEEKRSLPFGGNLPLMGSFAGGKLEERIRDVMTKRKSAAAGVCAAVVSAAAAVLLNVTVLPCAFIAADMSAAEVYEYSGTEAVYDDRVTEYIPVGYYYYADNGSEEAEEYYSDIIVEQAAYADYPYEEITEADYTISVSETAAETDADKAVPGSIGRTASNNQDPFSQGNYIIVHDYQDIVYSYTTTGTGGIYSDTTVMIKVSEDGSGVSKQTEVTPAQTR